MKIGNTYEKFPLIYSRYATTQYCVYLVHYHFEVVLTILLALVC